jgi:hypothetical protein
VDKAVGVPDTLGGSPVLGGIEGIYGMESMPLSWSSAEPDGTPSRTS